jgi:hypothetical protein
MDDDALNASRLNANPGGKQPKMRDTEIPVTECGPKVRNLKVVPSSSPPRYVQSMVFKAGDVLLTEKAERVLKAGDSLIDQAKGAVQVAKECDLYKKGTSSLRTPPSLTHHGTPPSPTMAPLPHPTRPMPCGRHEHEGAHPQDGPDDRGRRWLRR